MKDCTVRPDLRMFGIIIHDGRFGVRNIVITALTILRKIYGTYMETALNDNLISSSMAQW